MTTSDGEEIETTMFHPFYVVDEEDENASGRWVAASNLVSGDVLLMEDGQRVYVDEVRIEKLAEEINVYNLEVDELHTYFVAGGVLVHNDCEIIGEGERPDELEIESSQLGKKWGKHKDDYPELTSYSDYKQLAIFYNPEKIVFDNAEGEIYYINGNNLLRVKESGRFVSLYHGVNRSKVIKAIIRIMGEQK